MRSVPSGPDSDNGFDRDDDDESSFWSTDESWKARNYQRSLPSFSAGGEERFLGHEELNERFSPSPTQRLRYVIQPDEQFAVIFSWNVIIRNARELDLEVWQEIARSRGLLLPDMDDVVRAEYMPREKAIQRVFFWNLDWGETKSLAFEHAVKVQERFLNYDFSIDHDVVNWLRAMGKHKITRCLHTSRRRQEIVSVLERLNAVNLFEEFVTVEDECSTPEQVILTASFKAQRPPQHCAIFADNPRDVLAAHEVSAKAVGRIGPFSAFELKLADVTFKDFDELSVYNVRRLFGSLGTGPQDLQLEREEKRYDGGMGPL
eukprot:CAMPEP_0184679996 /NCGR_PEP_ID=MMETSP0312-20130426/2859_1 /TAXON_ID=31354 /ORGANISM="Compsopogon coeruleus, Strain SAG 36.94" /LENGTH=317 /DNA_ID=CAMNT_0027129803 /DNA_START=377 /DNA_END=1331 /DNA_ORIENTATION=+